MVLLSVVFLAVAVSFDALVIGITYGINRITISLGARLILSLVSGCAIFFAMLLGLVLEKQLSPRAANVLGGLILMLLGIYTIWRNGRPTRTQRLLLNWRIPFLGVIVQVFQEPLAADYDQSQHLSSNEALLLGFALALDAVAAGFGAAILRLPLLPTTVSVIFASFLFITQGLQTGARLADRPRRRKNLPWLPGTLIFFLGLLKIFF